MQLSTWVVEDKQIRLGGDRQVLSLGLEAVDDPNAGRNMTDCRAYWSENTSGAGGDLSKDVRLQNLMRQSIR